MYPFEGSYDVRLSVSNQFGTDTIFKTGTTSQRGNTAPVPLITSATLQPTTSPSTEVTAIVPTASTTKPSTTMAPVSLMVPIVAAVVGLLAIIVVKQK
jgi:PKD repeat protein